MTDSPPATAATDEVCDYVPVDPQALQVAAEALHRDGYDEGDYVPEEADPEDYHNAEVVLQGLREAGYKVLLRHCSCMCILCTVLPEPDFEVVFEDD